MAKERVRLQRTRAWTRGAEAPADRAGRRAESQDGRLP